MDALADSVCIHQLILKRRSKQLGCSCNCRRLTYSSSQLTHMSSDDHTVQLIDQVRVSHGGQNEDKTLLRCGQNLRGPFLRATYIHCLIVRSSDGGERGRQKGSQLYHQGEFLHNYYTFVSLHDCDDEGVVRIFVHRPFLRAVRIRLD